jgi:hypothetical protein
MTLATAQRLRSFGAGLACAALLSACQTGPYVSAPVQSQQIEVLRLEAGQTPPQKAGACWASDTAPAVIETVTEHVQSRPERRDGAGNIVQSAQFETRTAQRMVQDRQTVWFLAPCPAEITVAFVASVQRALKARGEFNAPITGAWDSATLQALRKFQRARGLDSAQISLHVAREFGLSATAF